MYDNKKIAVVMPAYNAAKTLVRTYEDLPHELIDDVILVDDASNICLVHNGIQQQGARWLNLELLVIVSCVTSMCFLTQYKSPCPRISGEAPAHPVQAAGAV